MIYNKKQKISLNTKTHNQNNINNLLEICFKKKFSKII